MSFWAVLAWVLIVEGALPLIAPSFWRQVVDQIRKLRDGQLRFYGLCSVAAGGLLLLLLA
jgi:uncharacterized protein YjeT (DUF2065 family)